jgi:hypothetical protein
MRRPAHRAIEGETEVATFTQRDKRLVAGSRELVLVGKKGSFLKAGPWAVTEQGRDIATIPRLYWGRSKITVTVIDEATARLDPRLTLFALWCASKISTTVVL